MPRAAHGSAGAAVPVGARAATTVSSLHVAPVARVAGAGSASMPGPSPGRPDSPSCGPGPGGPSRARRPERFAGPVVAAAGPPACAAAHCTVACARGEDWRGGSSSRRARWRRSSPDRTEGRLPGGARPAPGSACRTPRASAGSRSDPRARPRLRRSPPLRSRGRSPTPGRRPRRSAASAPCARLQVPRGSASRLGPSAIPGSPREGPPGSPPPRGAPGRKQQVEQGRDEQRRPFPGRAHGPQASTSLPQAIQELPRASPALPPDGYRVRLLVKEGSRLDQFPPIGL